MKDPPRWLRWHERTFPSASTVLVLGSRPILVDTGFGHDHAHTEQVLAEAALGPEQLELVVNTHHHSDHVGGNHRLQSRCGVPIAAHPWEADLVNRRDPDACSSRWLDQPVQAYHVDVLLEEGDVLDAGGPLLRVLHTPGHTLGHVSLYAEEERVLIAGDAVHGDDVGWINPYREGAGALHRAMATVERLSFLGVRWAVSGHGPPITDPARTLDAAHSRYEGWLREPERMAWHAAKRIFAFALMIRGALPRERAGAYLVSCPWFGDISRHAMGVEPVAFVEPFLEEMLRSGAAVATGGMLGARAPHDVPSPAWADDPTRPDRWPAPPVGTAPSSA